MFLIREGVTAGIPKNIKKVKERIRMDCVLQTCGDINKNGRLYSRKVLEDGITKINDSIKTGTLLGELDHPTSGNMVRQCTVLYKEASHRFLELGWEGNKLIGVIETLRTPNGTILKNLAEDGIPVGFSFRGTGDVKNVSEGGRNYTEILSPLNIICWDSVSNPSHSSARLLKINESRSLNVRNEVMTNIFSESKIVFEDNNVICTNDGVCYLPNDYDIMIDKRVTTIYNKYSI